MTYNVSYYNPYIQIAYYRFITPKIIGGVIIYPINGLIYGWLSGVFGPTGPWPTNKPCWGRGPWSSRARTCRKWFRCLRFGKMTRFLMAKGTENSLGRRWWFQIFFEFATLGKWSNFDEHCMFQMGWFNHQLDFAFYCQTTFSLLATCQGDDLKMTRCSFCVWNIYSSDIYGCFLKWWYPHFTPQNDHS